MEALYRYLSSSTAFSSLPFILILTVGTSFLISCIFLLLTRPGSVLVVLIQVLVTFVIIFALEWAVYQRIRGKVHEYRVERTKSVIDSIPAIVAETPQEQKNPKGNKPVIIDTWERGLEAIKKNPTEIGYYLTTADLLEKEQEYYAAMILLESGLDYFPEPPLPICERLQLYYEKLDLENRPSVSKCKKIIRIW